MASVPFCPSSAMSKRHRGQWDSSPSDTEPARSGPSNRDLSDDDDRENSSQSSKRRRASYSSQEDTAYFLQPHEPVETPRPSTSTCSLQDWENLKLLHAQALDAVHSTSPFPRVSGIIFDRV